MLAVLVNLIGKVIMGQMEAADFGRRRVLWWTINARRNCSVLVGARLSSACIVFFSAFARAVVDHAGVAGTALDPMVWSVGGAPERRRVVHAVRDRALIPGPVGVWDGEWDVVAATHIITCHDIELWPYSVSMLVKCVSFLYTCTGLIVGRILEWVVSLMLSCSSFRSYGRVSSPVPLGGSLNFSVGCSFWSRH